MQHAATQCNTLQHSATQCNTVQHSATKCNKVQHSATQWNTVQHSATHCNTLQHTATHYIMPSYASLPKQKLKTSTGKTPNTPKTIIYTCMYIFIYVYIYIYIYIHRCVINICIYATSCALVGFVSTKRVRQRKLLSKKKGEGTKNHHKPKTLI